MIIKWMSIDEASHYSGLDQDFLRSAIAKNILKAKTFGDKGGKTMLTDIELNRFSLDLQYPKSTTFKHRAKEYFNEEKINNKDFLNSIYGDKNEQTTV